MDSWAAELRPRRTPAAVTRASAPASDRIRDGGRTVTGPQHYREAERLLSSPEEIDRGDVPREASIVAEAQVHATLALAAATALAGSGLESAGWRDAAGTTTAIPGENRPMRGSSARPGQQNTRPAGKPGRVSRLDRLERRAHPSTRRPPRWPTGPCPSRCPGGRPAPLLSDLATSSAAWRHTWQVRNRASPSFHSPVLLSRYLGVEAIRNRATGWPAGVKRSSGYSVHIGTAP